MSSSRWGAVQAGDVVSLRPKRAAGSMFTVTVREVLDRHLADGRGFVDEEGTTYREFYYDVQVPAVEPRAATQPYRQRNPMARRTRPVRWSAVGVGDLVTLRPKRTAGALKTVEVERLLEWDRIDGHGFVDADGTTYREFYFDLSVERPGGI